MSTAAQNSDSAVLVDVVSDVVCPWCYIGKRRLEAALALAGATSARVRWHPFQLNPDLPPAGVDRRSYLEAKFGGPARAAEIYARVEAAGAEVGIAFAFDRIARQPNTVDAHRLVWWAQATAPAHADALMEALFAAYFTEGADLSDRSGLARLAGAAGYDRDAALRHLASKAGQAEVAAADERAKATGVTGVPFFIFNRRIAVAGAQLPEVLRGALAQAGA